VLLAFALGDLSQVAGVKGVDTAGQFDAVVANYLSLGSGEDYGVAENFTNSLGAGVGLAVGIWYFACVELGG
jgi:hypothetical protein